MDSEKLFLGGLTGLLALISFLMIAPFTGYILTAIILAFVLKPVQRRFEKFVGSNLSASFLIVGFIAAVLAPFGLAINAVIGDAGQVIDDLDEAETLDFSSIEESIEQYTSQEVDIESELRDSLESFADITVGGFTEILDLLTGLAIGLFILLFSLFYLLKDGEKLQAWLKSVTPVSDDLQDELYSEVSLMTWSVLKGHVLVAVIEGLLGGLALYLAGVPNFAFWTFIMILLSFIPVVGAFLVWAPAAVYLFVIGEPLSALFLALYGLIVIGLADNLLRPYLVDKRAEIHPAAILVGVIGGVYFFGAVGLFIGPVIFGFAKTMLDVLMKPDVDL